MGRMPIATMPSRIPMPSVRTSARGAGAGRAHHSPKAGPALCRLSLGAIISAGHSATGGPRFGGGPWGRHSRHGGSGREPRGEAFRTLPPSVGNLIALLRASDPAQAGQIKAVLDDARRRIAAILAETPSTPTPTMNV